MKKISLMLLIMALVSISATLTGFADPGDKAISTKKVEDIQKNINMDKSFVNKPKDFLLSTVNDTVVVSGEGKEGDRVLITLYKKSGGEFVYMSDKIELSLGALGVFTKEISLKDSNPAAPKEALASKETLIVLELIRSGSSTYDYRLIKYSDEKEVKETLKAIRLI